jgi:hypothetical protein
MNYMYSHLKPETLWPDPLFVTINLQGKAESNIKLKRAQESYMGSVWLASKEVCCGQTFYSRVGCGLWGDLT